MVKKLKSKKIVCAISGGVDSSVAAALLKRAGFAFRQTQGNPEQFGPELTAEGLSRGVDVVGVFMKLHRFSSESEKRARLVARKLGIPFYVFNFEKEFKKRIVDYFLKEYKTGRTPNPCVVCNKQIKFGLLLKKALSLGADFVATGHYARTFPSFQIRKTVAMAEVLRKKDVKKDVKLLKGKDREKDQSYFLWMLNQKQLGKILFPVGNYTKSEVRNLARKFKLPTAEAKESQEICFIKTTINDFLKKHIKPKAGKVIDKEGRVLGAHEGLFFYTVGQRKGIKLPGGPAFARLRRASAFGSTESAFGQTKSAGKPFYVLDKDLKRDILVVTQNERDLYKKELIAKNVNWVSGKEPKLPLKVKAKIRYRSELASATITNRLKSKVYRLKFKVAQRAITPGQSVVFYSGQEVLGGGIIEKIAKKCNIKRYEIQSK